MGRRRAFDVIMTSEEVTIGELVQLTDMRYSTLKYYTEVGLLPFRQAEERITRRYPRVSTIQRLAEINQLKAKGKTIDEIVRKLTANENRL